MDPMRAERRGDARKRILMAMLAVLTRSAVSASSIMTERALQEEQKNGAHFASWGRMGTPCSGRPLNEPLRRTSRRRSRRSGGAIPSG